MIRGILVGSEFQKQPHALRPPLLGGANQRGRRRIPRALVFDTIAAHKTIKLRHSMQKMQKRVEWKLITFNTFNIQHSFHENKSRVNVRPLTRTLSSTAILAPAFTSRRTHSACPFSAALRIAWAVCSAVGEQNGYDWGLSKWKSKRNAHKTERKPEIVIFDKRQVRERTWACKKNPKMNKFSHTPSNAECRMQGFLSHE